MKNEMEGSINVSNNDENQNNTYNNRVSTMLGGISSPSLDGESVHTSRAMNDNIELESNIGDHVTDDNYFELHQQKDNKNFPTYNVHDDDDVSELHSCASAAETGKAIGLGRTITGISTNHSTSTKTSNTTYTAVTQKKHNNNNIKYQQRTKQTSIHGEKIQKPTVPTKQDEACTSSKSMMEGTHYGFGTIPSTATTTRNLNTNDITATRSSSSYITSPYPSLTLVDNGASTTIQNYVQKNTRSGRKTSKGAENDDKNRQQTSVLGTDTTNELPINRTEMNHPDSLLPQEQVVSSTREGQQQPQNYFLSTTGIPVTATAGIGNQINNTLTSNSRTIRRSISSYCSEDTGDICSIDDDGIMNPTEYNNNMIQMDSYDDSSSAVDIISLSYRETDRGYDCTNNNQGFNEGNNNHRKDSDKQQRQQQNQERRDTHYGVEDDLMVYTIVVNTSGIVSNDDDNNYSNINSPVITHDRTSFDDIDCNNTVTNISRISTYSGFGTSTIESYHSIDHNNDDCSNNVSDDDDDDDDNDSKLGPVGNDDDECNNAKGKNLSLQDSVGKSCRKSLNGSASSTSRYCCPCLPSFVHKAPNCVKLLLLVGFLLLISSIVFVAFGFWSRDKMAAGEAVAATTQQQTDNSNANTTNTADSGFDSETNKTYETDINKNDLTIPPINYTFFPTNSVASDAPTVVPTSATPTSVPLSTPTALPTESIDLSKTILYFVSGPYKSYDIDPSSQEPVLFNSSQIERDNLWSYETIQNQLGQIPTRDGLSFMIQLGDWNTPGETSCDELVYQNVSTFFQASSIPVYFILGDNEFNDCDDPILAKQYWSQYLVDYETKFWNMPTWTVWRQGAQDQQYDAYYENFDFTNNQRLAFCSLSIPGGDVYVGDDQQQQDEFILREDANLAWLDASYQYYLGQVDAIVVLFHDALPGSNVANSIFFNVLLERIETNYSDMNFILVHGGGAIVTNDSIQSNTNNRTTFQLEYNGIPNVCVLSVHGPSWPPVQVTIETNGQDTMPVVTFDTNSWIFS